MSLFVPLSGLFGTIQHGADAQIDLNPGQPLQAPGRHQGLLDIKTLADFHKLHSTYAWVMLLYPTDACANKDHLALCQPFLKLFRECAEDKVGGWSFALANVSKTASMGKPFTVTDPSVQHTPYHALWRKEKVAWLGQHLCRQYCPGPQKELPHPMLVFFNRLQQKPEVITDIPAARLLLREVLELRAKEHEPFEEGRLKLDFQYTRSS